MARRLAAAGAAPTVLLSSTALRARTTAQAFGDALGLDAVLMPELYGASAQTLFASAAETGADAVVVVAHDPGLSDLASMLADVDVQMTTCAVAIFAWPTSDWDGARSTPPVDWRLDAPR